MATLSGIDFGQNGKQFGQLEISHSTHRSAYGKIMIPVIFLRNGDGPRALISAGVHGDEYEGQITVRKLAHDLLAEDISGSLILLPAANVLSVEDARRTSRVDGGNLNRLFPGDISGQPTEMIAYAIEHLLLAECDFAYDIHSGGSSLLYDALAVTTETGNAQDDASRLDMLRSLGISFGIVLPASSPMGLNASLDGAMLRQNVIGVSAEFGGAGTISARSLSRCQNSVHQFLAHCGLVQNPTPALNAQHCDLFDVTHPEAHVYAGLRGLIEPRVYVGDTVQPGDLLGVIYPLDDCESLPVSVNSGMNGTVLCNRPMPLVQKGDCLFQIGQKLAAQNHTLDADDPPVDSAAPAHCK
ncbi:MAG: succinylglutamate desuccinylase/aspartoacylase family protein [Litoreibacter sp.]